MKVLLVLSIILFTTMGCVPRENPIIKGYHEWADQYRPLSTFSPHTHDAYGPGIHMDATGRPFSYYDRQGNSAYGPVQRDAYGLGVHMDQYGRPVQAR